MAERGLQDIISAIADGTSIDWTTAEAAAEKTGDLHLLRRLRCIADAVDGRQAAQVDPIVTPKPIRAIFSGILVLASVKTALGSLAAAVLIVQGAALQRHIPSALLTLAVFGVAGATLVFGGSHDVRSRRLGMFFVVTASAFADRLLAPFTATPPLGPAVSIAIATATDAFLAVALWVFVWEFPAVARRRLERRFNQQMVRLSAIAGAVLFLASAVPLLVRWGFEVPARVTEFAAALDRHSPSDSYYWPILFCMVAAALPYLAWKSRFEPPDEQRRALIFVVAFIAGLTPMIVAVIVSPFVSFFDDPVNRDRIGVFLYASLLSIVPMTAYAVRVTRALKIEIIVTAAMRHAAIRYAVWLAGIAPICAMVFYTYFNRYLTVTQILSRQAPLVLLPLAGLVALTFRHQILQAIERRLTGERPDYLQAVARIQLALREAQSVRYVVDILTEGLRRALHTSSAEVLLLDETASALTSVTKTVRPLQLGSTLGDLIRQTRDEIYVGASASAPLQLLLPQADRRWLTDHGFQMLVPLTSAPENLLGLIALGEKRNGRGFPPEDRLVLSMVASHATMLLENLSLRDLPYRHLTDPARRNWRRIDWDNEPGALCPSCHKVFPAREVICECGSRTTPAALPLVLRGNFRVERLLGTGGMGVVYLATDLSLNRRVAVKTIRCLTPERVERLEREALAMASVLHPNLAMIFAVERWRGAPVLIVEYLEGGTLADYLSTSRLEVTEAIELGIVLADVLDQMHALDILHRDIKPSNIGYARDGTPKLMDFGVARVDRRRAAADAASSDVEAADVPAIVSPVARTSLDHVIGTPLYLSPDAVDGEDPKQSSDLWSLSVTLFEAVTGVHPFRADSIGAVLENISRTVVADARTLNPSCPANLAAFFADALARDPRRRPATATDVRNRLSLVRAELQRS